MKKPSLDSSPEHKPEYCNESSDGRHEPDPSTFHLEQDGDGVYVDVNCGKCGRSGCIGRFKAEDVDW